jgi:hypothetical protein
VNPYAERALADRSPAPEGHHLEARPARNWRPATGLYKKCRGGRRCPAEPVAELNRRRNDWHGGRTLDAWWAYCAEHMYGRWVEAGRVWSWILVEDTVDGAA